MSNRSLADWLRLIRGTAADSRRVRLTRHARERMAERDVPMRAVLNVLRCGTFDDEPAPVASPPGHWIARLSDREGHAVAVGLDPDDEPVELHVVTVMRSQ